MDYSADVPGRRGLSLHQLSIFPNSVGKDIYMEMITASNNLAVSSTATLGPKSAAI